MHFKKLGILWAMVLIIAIVFPASILMGQEKKTSGKKSKLNWAGNDRFVPEKLTTCVQYEVTDLAPVYLKRMEEGDVAYYGLILLTEKEKAMADYLIANRQNLLWEYERGYGPTSADSALVIEGLYHYGMPKDFLLQSLKKISEKYFDISLGGFKTVAGSSTSYWLGVSVETTAHIAYLMQRIAPDDFKNEIEASLKYVLSQQQSTGHWQGRWFPSHNIPTYYAVRFLKLCKISYASEISKAATYLTEAQLPDGSWAGTVIETSSAILALRAAGYDGMAIQKGIEWLQVRLRDCPCFGEPVLYYWIEKTNPPRKLFFSCSDKGQISNAWARMALSNQNY